MANDTKIHFKTKRIITYKELNYKNKLCVQMLFKKYANDPKLQWEWC